MIRILLAILLIFYSINSTFAEEQETKSLYEKFCKCKKDNPWGSKLGCFDNKAKLEKLQYDYLKNRLEDYIEDRKKLKTPEDIINFLIKYEYITKEKDSEGHKYKKYLQDWQEYIEKLKHHNHLYTKAPKQELTINKKINIYDKSCLDIEKEWLVDTQKLQDLIISKYAERCTIQSQYSDCINAYLLTNNTSYIDTHKITKYISEDKDFMNNIFIMLFRLTDGRKNHDAWQYLSAISRNSSEPNLISELLAWDIGGISPSIKGFLNSYFYKKYSNIKPSTYLDDNIYKIYYNSDIVQPYKSAGLEDLGERSSFEFKLEYSCKKTGESFNSTESKFLGDASGCYNYGIYNYQYKCTVWDSEIEKVKEVEKALDTFHNEKNYYTENTQWEKEGYGDRRCIDEVDNNNGHNNNYIPCQNSDICHKIVYCNDNICRIKCTKGNIGYETDICQNKNNRRWGQCATFLQEYSYNSLNEAGRKLCK